MDKVTQQNAAGAEESASVAEQLSAQAQTVKGMVDELSAMVGGARAKTTAEGTPQTAPAGQKMPVHAHSTQTTVKVDKNEVEDTSEEHSGMNEF